MIEFRKGDTFSMIIEMRDAGGQPLTAPAGNLVAQLFKLSDNTIFAPLTIANMSEPGFYQLSTSLDTSTWEEQVLVTNLFDTVLGKSSSLVHIKVVKQYSRVI